MKLLGIDPGLAAFGLAVATLDDTGVHFSRVEVIRTEKASKARRLRSADDLSDRARTIYRRLLELALADGQAPAAVCIEATALPFGKTRSSVVSALGRVRGLVDAFAVEHGCAIVEFTPQELKQHLCGAKDASKEAIQAALLVRHPTLAALWPKQKTLLEHAGDACAAVLAGAESDVIAAARRVERAVRIDAMGRK